MAVRCSERQKGSDVVRRYGTLCISYYGSYLVFCTVPVLYRVGGSGKVHVVNKSEAEFKRYRQCWGSGIFIPDPGSGFFHPGSGAATHKN